MRKIVLALACLGPTCHGRRLHPTIQSREGAGHVAELLEPLQPGDVERGMSSDEHQHSQQSGLSVKKLRASRHSRMQNSSAVLASFLLGFNPADGCHVVGSGNDCSLLVKSSIDRTSRACSPALVVDSAGEPPCSNSPSSLLQLDGEEDFDEPWHARPLVQIPSLIGFFVLHMAFISRANLPILPKKVVISAENVVGIALISWLLSVRRRKRAEKEKPLDPNADWIPPWERDEKPSWEPPWGKLSKTKRSAVLDTTLKLMICYYLWNYISMAIDYGFLGLIALGAPLSRPKYYALQILFSHLTWNAMALVTLATQLPGFFPRSSGERGWIRFSWRKSWLGWVGGGFYASVLLENFLFIISHAAQKYANKKPLSDYPRSPGTEIVAKLTKPEDGDVVAIAIGTLLPCITGPVFEEVLNRGFLLPALHRFMPIKYALPIHAFIFGVQHRSLALLLPSTITGLLWGWLYMASGNLLVSSLIHVLWNTKVFIETIRYGSR